MYVYLYTYYYILLQQNISQHDSMLNSRILRNATAQADQTATGKHNNRLQIPWINRCCAARCGTACEAQGACGNLRQFPKNPPVADFWSELAALSWG